MLGCVLESTSKCKVLAKGEMNSTHMCVLQSWPKLYMNGGIALLTQTHVIMLQAIIHNLPRNPKGNSYANIGCVSRVGLQVDILSVQIYCMRVIMLIELWVPPSMEIHPSLIRDVHAWELVGQSRHQTMGLCKPICASKGPTTSRVTPTSISY